MKKLFYIVLIFAIQNNGLAYIQAPKSQTELDKAFEMTQQGKDLYYKLSLDEAEKTLKNAQALYSQNLLDLTRGEHYYDAIVFRSLCLFSKKNLLEAKTELKQAYQLNPSRKLDPKIFSPEFISFFHKSTQDFKKESHGILEINSTPSFAKVWINGFEVGMTPLIIKNWPKTDHVVRITSDDFKDWAQKVTIGNQNSVKLNARLEPLGDMKILSQKLSKASSLSLEAQNFLKALEKEDNHAPSPSSSMWFWSLAALAVGGATYAIMDHNREQKKSSPPVVIANIP